MPQQQTILVPPPNDEDDRALPSSVREAIRQLIQSAQLFGSASGRQAPLSECTERMARVKEDRRSLCHAITAALSQRYEAGLEITGEKPR